MGVRPCAPPPSWWWRRPPPKFLALRPSHWCPLVGAQSVWAVVGVCPLAWVRRFFFSIGRNQCEMVLTHLVWTKRCCGWSSLNQPFVPAFSAAEPLFWGQTHSPSLSPPSRERWSTGRAMGLPALFYHGFSTYDLVVESARADRRCEPRRLVSCCRCEPCRLVVVGVVVDVVVLSAHHRELGLGSQ